MILIFNLNKKYKYIWNSNNNNNAFIAKNNYKKLFVNNVKIKNNLFNYCNKK